MSSDDEFDPAEAVCQLEEEKVLRWVERELDQATPPLEIADALSDGLERLGVRPRVLSGYTGVYTEGSDLRLNIFDADATFRQGPVLLRTEWAMANQQLTNDALNRFGGYAMIAVRATRGPPNRSVSPLSPRRV